eukprot:gene10601-12539_t
MAHSMRATDLRTDRAKALSYLQNRPRDALRIESGSVREETPHPVKWSDVATNHDQIVEVVRKVVLRADGVLRDSGQDSLALPSPSEMESHFLCLSAIA